MRIAVLGPLEVRDDGGRVVEIPGAKERLLLAVLAADAGRVVSTDRITEALWNADAPPSARKSLQAHLVRLRTALEPDRPRGSAGRYVVRRGTGYALEVDRGDLDALRFAELTALGRSRLGAGEPGEAARVLAEATALWRGEPYADWPDADFAAAERRRLAELRAAALTALVEARLEDGGHADVVPELERLVAAEPLREDWWRLLVLALYRSGRQADALSAARRARAVLADELGADPGPALRDVERAVLAQDPALDPPPRRELPAPAAVPAGPARCPYLGLATYQPADAPLFRGRRRLVERLVARLVDRPLLVVSGPSGAGKSSAVRAGLVPALASGALRGSESWRPVLLTPGAAPVDALAPLTGDDVPDVPVLLVCDQLEELWAPGIDAGERRTFLDSVLGLLDDGVAARCVLVVRGDHVGRLAEHAGLVDRVAEALVLVPPLDDPELREVVREPAAAAGLTVEPELVDAVVADVLGRPGALPLLSTALVGTWERRRGSVLTLAGYLEAGGVQGALTRSAETAYGSLDPDGRAAARRLLVRLADVDDQGTLVGRRVPLAELGLGTGVAGPVQEVVEAFVDRRLLSIGGSALEVAHEALLRAWPRLVRWLEADAAGRVVRRHLAPAALEWDRGGRPADELYRGARLAGALEWAARDDADPTPVERDFLEEARARADAELDDARRRAAQEAAGRRRTRRLAAGLAAGLVAALVATAVAVRSSRDAREASTDADAARLAALSGTVGSADLALLLAVQAYRLADLPETRSALLGAVVGYGRVQRVGSVGEPVDGIVAASDGTVLVDTAEAGWTWPSSAPGPRASADRDAWSGTTDRDAGSEEGLVVGGGEDRGIPWVRAGRAGEEPRDLPVGRLGGSPLAVASTDEGSRVAAVLQVDGGGGRWRVVGIDVADGRVQPIGTAGRLDVNDPLAADLDDEGRTGVVASLGNAPVAEAVDLRDGRRTPLRVPGKVGRATGVRALGSGPAQLWSDGELTLYRPDGEVRQRLDTGLGRIADVVLAPDGTWGATVGSAGAIAFWDVDAASGLWTVRDEVVGHAGEVVDAEVGPDGSTLLTAGQDGRVVVWDARTSGGFGIAVQDGGGGFLLGPPAVVDPGRLVVGLTVAALPPRFVPDAPEPLVAAFFSPVTGVSADSVRVGFRNPASRDVPAVAVSPDRSMVAARTEEAVVVLDARSGDELARWAPDRGVPLEVTPRPSLAGCLAWAPDGSRVLVCTRERGGSAIVAVDPRRDGGTVAGRTSTDAPLEVLATSPDRRLLIGANLDRGTVVALDAATLEVLHRADVEPVEGARASHVAVSPDGGRVAVSGAGGLTLVDTATWEPAEAPAPLNGDVRQAEWFPDGRTLAVVGGNGTTYLYDVEQGQAYPLPLLSPGDDPDAGVHLVPGITHELVVLASLANGRRYPLDPGTWSTRACDVVGRDLTAEERDRYLPARESGPACSAPG